MPLPTLHGKRVTLRPLGEEDIEQLVMIVALPGVREWWSASDLDPERLRPELRNGRGLRRRRAGGVARDQ